MGGTGPEVGSILEELGLGQLAPRFAAEDIDARVFLMLSDADLKELGLTLGQRRKVLDEIARRRGSLLSEAASRPVQQDSARAGLDLRRLTVVIADIVGSTELASRLGPDGMHDLLQAYYAHARGAAERHGGHFQPMQGDGAILLFGYPHTRGATAERAVEAALQLQAELAATPHPLADGNTLTIRARLGISTGKAMVGYSPGARQHDGLQIVGPVVNRAARLQALADPGAVLADAATIRLAVGFTVEELPAARLKGFDEAVPVLRVIGRRIAPADLPLPRAAVQTAHRDELAALDDAWLRARAGGAALVVVTGDAGIGKSTLLSQLQSRAMAEGARVLRLACSALETNTPLGPLRALLRTPAEQGAGIMAALERQLGPGLHGETAEIATLLGLAGDGIAAAPARPSDRGRLLGLLAGRLLQGDGRPTLMIVEDLHWADATTRDLLAECGRRAGDHGVLIVASSRNAAEKLWSDEPRHTLLALSPLPERSARQVLSSLLGGRVLPDAIAALILSRSDGNPLMLEMLARQADAWGEAEFRQAPEVPTSIYESVAARLDDLTAGRALVETLSVFDAPVAEGTLARAIDMGAQELGAAAVELCAAGITEWVGDGRQRSLAFRHSLYREVTYERLVRAARHRLHRAAFRALLASDPTLAEQAPAILAWHADEAGEYAQAAPLALQAGEAALARSALIEAGHHFDRALAALERVARSRPVDMMRLRALTGMASVKRAREGIASDEAGRLGRAVLALARELGETRTELLALNGLYTFALVRADYRAAGSWAQELEQVAALAQDATFRMFATRAMGVVALHTGSPVVAAERLRLALDSYDRERHLPLAFAHGYDHAEICAVFLSFALWLKGDLAGSAEVGAFSVSHSRDIDHAHSLAQALTFRAMLLALARDEVAALQAAREGADVGARYDLRAMHGVGEFLELAVHLACRDAPVTAEDTARLLARHDRFRAVNPYNYLPLSLALVADVLMRAGDLDAAAAMIAEAESVQDRTAEIWARPEVTRQKARLALARGQEATARALMLAALEDAASMGAVMLELRMACELATTDSPQGKAQVAAALDRLASPDGGWDLCRAQSILGISAG